jgi:hypothetical protein
MAQSTGPEFKPSTTKTNKQKGLVVWLKVDPEFKLQY